MHFDSREGIKKLKSFMLTLEFYPPIDLCQNKRFINTCMSMYFLPKVLERYFICETETGWWNNLLVFIAFCIKMKVIKT